MGREWKAVAEVDVAEWRAKGQSRVGSFEGDILNGSDVNAVLERACPGEQHLGQR
jgi:hypothetical protein